MGFRKCIVKNCPSYSAKPDCEGITFHRFPQNYPTRQIWKAALKLVGDVTTNCFVCSLHFRDEDFQNKAKFSDFEPDPLGVKPFRRLKRGAKPTQRLQRRPGYGKVKDSPTNQQCEDKIMDVDIKKFTRTVQQSSRRHKAKPPLLIKSEEESQLFTKGILDDLINKIDKAHKELLENSLQSSELSSTSAERITIQTGGNEKVMDIIVVPDNRTSHGSGSINTNIQSLEDMVDVANFMTKTQSVKMIKTNDKSTQTSMNASAAILTENKQLKERISVLEKQLLQLSQQKILLLCQPVGGSSLATTALQSNSKLNATSIFQNIMFKDLAKNTLQTKTLSLNSSAPR